jgi:hypothetical protein
LKSYLFWYENGMASSGAKINGTRVIGCAAGYSANVSNITSVCSPFDISAGVMIPHLLCQGKVA